MRLFLFLYAPGQQKTPPWEVGRAFGGIYIEGKTLGKSGLLCWVSPDMRENVSVSYISCLRIRLTLCTVPPAAYCLRSFQLFSCRIRFCAYPLCELRSCRRFTAVPLKAVCSWVLCCAYIYIIHKIQLSAINNSIIFRRFLLFLKKNMQNHLAFQGMLWYNITHKL